MNTYVILRRSGWSDAEELRVAAERSKLEGDAMADEVRWIRSYVLAEPDGRVGTVCIYEGVDEDAVRRHAHRAELPVDEVVPVPDTVVVRPDPAPAAV